MKKIIRIASVIALASASLLYVGCTKDFSADIAKTNQDVAALNQKVESLNSTVQTINGTVESLKTTKADLSKVEELDAALKSALETKIGELQTSLTKTAGDAAKAAADAAAAKTDAAAAQAAADAVAEDLEKANAKLDTVIANVKDVADSLDIVAANLASVSEDVETLRADVDSLQNWQGEINTAINTLTGRVDALAARVTSIVAIPSVNHDVKTFLLDTIGTTGIDMIWKNMFVKTFKVTPASAVADIDTSNVKLNIRNGLTRAEQFNETFKVNSVSANAKTGELTVFVELASTNLEDFRYNGETLEDIISNYFEGYSGDYNWKALENRSEAFIKAFVNFLTGNDKYSWYYSLAFTDIDDASDEAYGVNSDYTSLINSNYGVTLGNIIKVVDADDEEVTTAAHADTVSYTEGAKYFKTAFNGLYKVKALYDGNMITLEELAAAVGVSDPKHFAIDTVCTTVDEILTIHEGIDVYRSGVQMNEWTYEDSDQAYFYAKGLRNDGTVNYNGIEKKSDGVFAKAKATDNHYFGNKTVATSWIMVSSFGSYSQVGPTFTDNLFIGGKKLAAHNLGKSTEDWYYDMATTAIKDEFEIKDAEAAADLDDTLSEVNEDGKFTLSKVNNDTVKVAVEDVKYAKEAADTTYKVEWATKYDLSKKADSTYVAFNWALYVGPRPADPEAIKFAAADTIIGKKVINVEFEGVYEASIAAIDELDNRSVIDAPKAVSVDGVKVTEKTFKGPNVTFSWTDKKTIVAKFDKAEAGKTYVIVAEADCAGITFTYEFTVTVVSAATPKLKALSAYVKEEGGKYSIEIAAPEPSKARYANRNYVANLNEVVFSHYFVIDTTDAKLANLKVDFADLDTTSTRVLGLHSVTAKDYVEFNDTPSEWAPYDSTVANVVAYLITNAQDTIDNVAIKFWTKEPIKSVAHVDSTVKHNNAKGDKINLDRLFTMKDYLDSTVWKNGAEVTGRGYYDYDIEIEYLNDTTWTITGGTLPKGAVHMDADAKTLVLEAQSAQIVNPVTVEIPFVVKHDLDKFGKAADDRQGTVKVTFTSAE